MAGKHVTVQDATEEFFGNAGGKVVAFETTETKRGFWGRTKQHKDTILLEIGMVRPEGGQDCWTFDGQVLSKRHSFKEGTSITGFYIGTNGRTDLGWGNKPKTGWIRQEA